LHGVRALIYCFLKKQHGLFQFPNSVFMALAINFFAERNVFATPLSKLPVSFPLADFASDFDLCIQGKRINRKTTTTI
jgi:hypothetical protein